MKVRIIRKKIVCCMLLLGVACVMMAGCGGKDDGRDDGLVSFTTHEAGQEEHDEESSGQESGTGEGSSSPVGTDGTKNIVKEDGSESSSGQEEDFAKDVSVEEVYVYVCGSVNNPGVYRLRPEARIYEAIEAAGGLCVDAAAECVNQARKVEDGLKIYVPNKEEAERGWEESSGASDVSGDGRQTDAPSAKVNVNTATVEELKTLPGIGDAKAQSIVSYRQTNGMFQSIEDLMKVEGIKNGVFDKIKDQITV